jgi:hypothetical protein
MQKDGTKLSIFCATPSTSPVRRNIPLFSYDHSPLTPPSDLTTRSGLKKVHANFDVFQKRLDILYTKHLGNEKIMGGIVGIYAKMSVDSILRDRIFKAG